MIPKKHTGYGEDKSPEMILSGVPEETVSLAIILDDLDVPFTKNYNHWLAWNIPNLEIIPEGRFCMFGIIFSAHAEYGKSNSEMHNNISILTYALHDITMQICNA